MNSPMKTLITRLLDEATMGSDGEAVAKMIRDAMPANVMVKCMECQVVLKSGYAVAGVLATTPEGTLRLLAPAKKSDNSTIIAEHFFDYDDVMTIVVGREMPQSIAQPSRNNGRTIIMGH
jgi:hypothetical protein